MKLPNPEEFKFKECTIAGDKCWLITPLDMKTKWNDDNAGFRSCIVRQSDNYVISQGFAKFVNFGERPDFQPWDNTWPIEARHKIDGSLLIVSKYKDELIIRTRGTTDARQLDNGFEIDILIAKYPKVFDNNWLHESSRCSILLEWTTKNNVIVLREHEEPTLTLVGAVGHYRPGYHTQDHLDNMAKRLGVGRPQRYTYNSIEECILDVDAWKGREGVVISSPDGQTLKKIKASEYCELHKLATGIKGVKQVLDVFMASPKFLDDKEFYNYIETTLDFEIAEKCKDFIEQIVKAYRSFKIDSSNIVLDIEKYICKYETRKEQAIMIQSRWKGWMVPYAFQVLDGKEVPDKLVRIAIESYLP